MQTEKSQPEGKRIMPEMKFTSFLALSVDPRVGISRYALETDDILFFLPIMGKIKALKRIFYKKLYEWPTPNVIWRFSLRRVKNVSKQLMSILMSRVSCLSS